MVIFILNTEPLREILLIVEVIVFVLVIQVGIIYVRKFLRTKRNYTILAWGQLLFAYGGVYLLYIIADFYIEYNPAEIPNIRDLVLGISYTLALVGAFLFSFNTEREIRLNKHLISMIIFSIAILLGINLFLWFIEGTYLTIIGWFIFIIMIIIYIRKFTAKIHEKWRLNVYSLIIGTILMVLGFGATADVAVLFFGGVWIRLVGDLLIITGLMLVSVLFIGVPSFAEFDWHEKVRLLNVIHSSGISLGYYKFQQKDMDENMEWDELLMGGGLISMSSFISNLVNSEKRLELVDHGDVTLLFDYGKYLINVLIIDEKLQILREKLRTFTNIVEYLYEENLQLFDGDLSQFLLLEQLARAQFEIKEKLSM